MCLFHRVCCVQFDSFTHLKWVHFDALVVDGSNAIASALELLQSCTKPSICRVYPYFQGCLSATEVIWTLWLERTVTKHNKARNQNSWRCHEVINQTTSGMTSWFNSAGTQAGIFRAIIGQYPDCIGPGFLHDQGISSNNIDCVNSLGSGRSRV